MIHQDLAHIRSLHEALPVHEVVNLYVALADSWPREPSVCQSLALYLMAHEEFAAAIEAADAALYRRKDAISYFIKGRALDEMLDLDRAIDCYRKCVSRNADNARAKFYLGLAYLTLGDFQKGARFYPFRLTDIQRTRVSGVRRWSPVERSGRVLIWAEQGIGDEVMFLQLLHFVAPLDFAFTVECDRRLLSLFRANFPAIRFVARDEAIDPRGFDYQIAMGDLLGLFHRPLLAGGLSRPGLAPIARPDIATRAAAIKAGRELIGISWLSGSGDYGARRSVPIQTLARALDPGRHALAILQYLPPEEEIAKLRARGFDCVADVDGFHDIEATFALIGACDSILTIDNSVAHFAGAAGIETHMLLPALPNWRWGLSGLTSHWYPGMRLHRRTVDQTWDDVMDTIIL